MIHKNMIINEEIVDSIISYEKRGKPQKIIMHYGNQFCRHWDNFIIDLVWGPWLEPWLDVRPHC